jgi:hypothetical protein
LISHKEEMRTVTESSGVVLHDMIERIYFYFIIFSQKRKWKREPHGRRGSSRFQHPPIPYFFFFHERAGPYPQAQLYWAGRTMGWMAD